MPTSSVVRIIPLDVTGVDPSATPDSVIEYTCFRLSPRNTDNIDSPQLGYYSPVVFSFVSLVLRHKYASSRRSRSTHSDFWYGFAGPRLERLTLMELYKVPTSERPVEIQGKIDETEREPDDVRFYGLGTAMERNNIELPSYDSEIPRWYAEWEKQHHESLMDREDALSSSSYTSSLS